MQDEKLSLKTEEDKAELIEKYHKSEDHLADMEEYCTLDDAGREAFIEDYKDSMGDKMSDYKGLTTKTLWETKCLTTKTLWETKCLITKTL
jgi:hypothetical protein